MMLFQWIKSLLFNGIIYLAMIPYGLFYFPWALFSSEGAFAACHGWARFVLWLARWMLGLKTEVRGTPPTGEVVVAAKHQSFLDVILIFSAIPRGKFIMKKELIWAPIIGQYGLRIGCVPVHRGKRGAAIRQMKQDVEAGRAQAGQLIIYPQGTRVGPDEERPYKVGTGVLYEQLGQPCVPVAANVGLYWPKRGVLRHPGTAIVEFLDPIPPGKPVRAFMAELEEKIETASKALVAEARGQG